METQGVKRRPNCVSGDPICVNCVICDTYDIVTLLLEANRATGPEAVVLLSS